MSKKAGLPIKKAEGSKAPIAVKIVHDEPTASASNKDYEERERKYRAKNALEDIERAEGHKRDKALMKDVKAVAREKIKTMKNIC